MQKIKTSLFVIILLVSLISSLSFPTMAQEGSSSGFFGVGLDVEYPLGASARLQTQTGIDHLQAFFKYGKTISSFTDSANSYAVNAGYYNSATGTIVQKVLSTSDIQEVGLTYSKIAGSSFSIDLGYQTLKGSSNITGSELINALASLNLPAGGNTYEIKASIESYTLRARYEYFFSAGNSLDVSLGVIRPNYMSSNLNRDTSTQLQRTLLAAANRELDSYLTTSFIGVVVIPVISLKYTYLF